MINNNVLLTVRNESDVNTVRELMIEQGRLSREEPGCLRFDVFHSQSDPRIFILIEQWNRSSTWQTIAKQGPAQNLQAEGTASGRSRPAPV